MQMKLSCVTAVYNAVATGNRERLIRCVESVAKIPFAHEHLVYDGGSTDGTVEVIQELANRVPNLKWQSESDKGIYDALNKGVRDATGDWFYVLGCDDYVASPDLLDRIIGCARDDDEVLVTPVCKDYGGRVREIGLSRRNLYWSTPYCHQGVLVRTRLMRELGGFAAQYRISADYDLMLRYHLQGAGVKYFKERFAVYSAGGFSERGAGRFGPEALAIMQKNFHLTDEQVAVFVRRVYLPLPKVVPKLFHCDATVRLASAYMLARWVLWHLGMKRS